MADQDTLDEMRDIAQAQKDLIRMWGCRPEFEELEKYLFSLLQSRLNYLAALAEREVLHEIFQLERGIDG